ELHGQERNSLPESGAFIQIPGPNPIVTAGRPGSWDDSVIEAADILEDMGAYYLYYHGQGQGAAGYQLGVARSSNPLGPFVKYSNNPIIPVGPKGSWDDANTFCSTVVRVTHFQSPDTKVIYYMLYGGTNHSQNSEVPVCNIGLATADNPLGPWKKSPSNPI